MEAKVNTTPKDVSLYVLWCKMQTPKGRSRFYGSVLLFSLAVTAFLFFLLHAWVSPAFNRVALLFLAFVASTPLCHAVVKSGMLRLIDREKANIVVGQATFVVSEEGLELKLADATEFFVWRQFTSVKCESNYGYLCRGLSRPFIIPKRCFETDEYFRQVMKFAIICHWNASRAAQSSSSYSAGKVASAATPLKANQAPIQLAVPAGAD
jgi:hypothetical protein